jgi:hypothetical protein
MLVLFGLKDTQSKELAGSRLSEYYGVLTVSVVDVRVLDRNVGGSISIPSVCVLCDIYAFACTSNVYIVEYDIGRVCDKMVVLGLCNVRTRLALDFAGM